VVQLSHSKEGGKADDAWRLPDAWSWHKAEASIFVRCHTPLPFEAHSVRHVIVRAGGADTAWLVRHCRNPDCAMSNLEVADDESDIERGMYADC
jgi:hypothetical protein